MASYTIGPKIGLDGEADFRKSLNNINETLRTLDTELKKTSSQFENNANSEEALKSKNDVLNRSIAEQEKKLTECKKALEYSKQEYGENASQTQKWQRVVNNTETDLNKLKNEVEKNEKAIEEMTDAANKSDNALDNMGDAAKDAASKSEKLQKIGAGIKSVGVAIGAVATTAAAAGAAIVSMADDTAAAGDNVDKMSQKLGLSREGFQEWDFVLSQNGVDIDSFGTGMKTLVSNMDSANSGNATAIENFKKLGISVTDSNGKLKSQEQMLNETVKAFQNMEDGTEKSRLATELFGKQGQNLMPLLNGEAGAVDDLKQKAQDLGMVMSDEAVTATVNYTDAMDALNRTLDGTKNKIMAELMPGMTGVIEGLTGMLAGTEGAEQQLKTGINDILSSVQEMLPGLMSMVQTFLGAFISALPQILEMGTDILLALVQGIIDNLPDLLDAALQTIIYLANALIDALPELIPAIVEIVLEMVEILTNPDTLEQLIMAALEIIVALAEGLVKALPKITDKIPIIISNIVKTFLKLLPQLIPVAIKLLSTLAQGLITHIGKLLAVIPKIISQLFGGFRNSNAGQRAREWGKDFIQNIIDGIKSMISSIGNAVSSVAEEITSFLHFSVPDKGPLVDTPKWMPDMIDVLVKGMKNNEYKLANAAHSLASTLNDEMQINASVRNISSGSQTLNLTTPVYLDGRIISQNTQKHITQTQNAMQFARGVINV